MGLKPDSIKEFKTRYAPAYIPSLPSTKVLIVDWMGKFHWIPEDCKTGADFTKRIEADIFFHYQNGGTTYILCLDVNEFSPPAKFQAAQERKKQKDSQIKKILDTGIPQLSIDEAGDCIIKENEPLPNWTLLMAHPQLKEDVSYYIFQQFTQPRADGSIFMPPKGCKLILHGVRDRPCRGEYCYRKWVDVFQIAWGEPHEMKEEEKSDFDRAFDGDWQQGQCAEEHTEQIIVKKLDHLCNCIGEAELACILYANEFADEDITILCSDNDIIPIVLLHSHDRLDTATAGFKNNIYIRIPKKRSVQDDNINVNMLYECIRLDSIIQTVQNPIVSVCALLVIKHCDFIRGFLPGVGTASIWKAFFENAERFSQLFRLCFSQHQYSHPVGHPTAKRVPVIDDALFIEFCYECYRQKYSKTVIKAGYKDDSYRSIRDYLKQHHKKKTDNHMMPRRLMLIFERNLLWLLTYWLNAYRIPKLQLDPTIAIDGISIYGYSKINDAEGVTKKNIMISQHVYSISDQTQLYRLWYCSEKKRRMEPSQKNDDECPSGFKRIRTDPTYCAPKLKKNISVVRGNIKIKDRTVPTDLIKYENQLAIKDREQIHTQYTGIELYSSDSSRFSPRSTQSMGSLTMR